MNNSMCDRDMQCRMLKGHAGACCHTTAIVGNGNAANAMQMPTIVLSPGEPCPTCGHSMGTNLMDGKAATRCFWCDDPRTKALKSRLRQAWDGQRQIAIFHGMPATEQEADAALNQIAKEGG